MPSTYELLGVRVARITELGPTLRRITLTGAGVAEMDELCLDRRVKLVLPPDGGPLPHFPAGDEWYPAWLALPQDERPALRTYTARAVRPEVAEFDIDVVRHGSLGPAGRWIESVRPGDTLGAVVPVRQPEGPNEVGIAWRPGHAREFLVAGDATAAPAIANIAAALPADATGTVLLEVPTSADVYPITAPAGVRVQVLPCDGARPGSRLEEALRDVVWPPDARECPVMPAPEADEVPLEGPIWDEGDLDHETTHYAWLAGESGAITRIRRHLVNERGCPRRRVAFMGYWRHGQPEC